MPPDFVAAPRLRGGKALDGPFAETKEALGGFFAVEFEDVEQAKDIAARIATDERSWVEIRQVALWHPK